MNNLRTVADQMDLVACRRYSTEQLVILDTITREALDKPLAQCTEADLDEAIKWAERRRTGQTPGGGTPWAPTAPFPA